MRLGEMTTEEVRAAVGGSRIGGDKRFRGARRVELLEVQVAEGLGCEDDMYRVVTYYLSPDGETLAVSDPAVLGVITDGGRGRFKPGEDVIAQMMGADDDH